MGIIRQHIRLANAARPELEEVDANALVDSSAMDLCITPLIAKQLRLEAVEQKNVTTADGRSVRAYYVGPILVEVFGRKAYTGGLVLGNEVLLGAIPMQAMDVLIDPRREQLVPNPANPDIPGALAMGFRTQHRD